MLGCDGIWEKYVDNSQGLIDIVKGNLEKKKTHTILMEEMLDNLIAKDTNEGLGCDNMTAILVAFN